MAKPVRFPAQGETPSRIAAGEVCQIQTIFVHNPSEVAGAYVKIYALAGVTAPSSSAVPSFSHWIAPGATGSGGHSEPVPAFIDGGNFWIAVATDAGAGLTAPDEDFEISITIAP